MDSGTLLPIMATIVFQKGLLVGQTFRVDKSVITLGRNPNNDIVIPDPKVSRNHARLVLNESTWSVENLSQNSLVTINQRRVEKGEIQDNATIGLGDDSAFLFLLVLDETVLDTVSMHPSAQLMAALNVNASPSSPLPIATGSDGYETAIALFPTFDTATLEVTDNTSGLHNVYALSNEVINIGRDALNDIVINDPMISKQHLQIVRENNQWVMIHPHPARQQTLNGLIYLGRTIQGDEHFRKVLERGDVFRIGNVQGTLVTLTYNDGSGAPQEKQPVLQPIQLHTDSITIGRLQDNDVVLNHPQVSAHHAQLKSEKGTYRLTDLGSTNHTYVNRLAVNSCLLKLNDEMRIGPYRLIFKGNELVQYDESASIRIDALNLVKTGTKQAILINNISLSIPPRSFVALVGGSGTGKSTLMDALNGLRPAQSGSVFYNGQDYYEHIASFRSLLGYVPQEDIIHRDLTVERALYYAAKLRLPSDFTRAQIEQRISEVLEDVEMTNRRGMLIKKLSGGQRKRISIALELLANPNVFFLDEPTSGLDPGLDRKMMILLRKLADKGHTILLVTHATNNINVCDAICFLANGGRLAYFGPAEEAKKYFEQPDFAEIYNLLEPTDEAPSLPAEAEEHFKQSEQYEKYISDPLEERPMVTTQSLQLQTKTKAKKRKPFKQFGVLTQRYLELLWNDKLNLSILLLQAPIIGVIIFLLIHTLNESTIYQPPISLANQGDAQRFLFILSFAAILFGCINSTREIVKEAPIYKRERAVNLGIIPYMFSKILVLSMLCLLQCAILLFIANLAAPFHDGIFLPEVWEVYITLALTAIAGVMVGLTISASVRNNDQAISFIPLILLPEIVFSGSMFALKGYPIQIFGAIFSMRWSMAALGSSVNLIGNGDKVFGSCDSCNTYQHNLNYLLFTWGALLATIVILGIITAIILKRKDRQA